MAAGPAFKLPPISFIRLRRFMPSWVTEGDWSKGMVQDAPRAALPTGTLVNSIDYLLDSPGIATKRGGTVYAGPVMTGATTARAVIYADFQAGSQIVAVGSNGHLYKVTSGATTDVNTMGAAYVPVCKPVFFSGGSPTTKQYVIIPTNDGSAAFKKYNGSAVSLASTPKGTIVTTYKGRLVLANDHVNQTRLWFSPATVTAGNDIDQAWDVTNAWVDAEYPVTGLASLQNSLLIFSNHQTERLTGTTPPPGTDFDHAPVGKVGCTDARSITVWQNYAIFANARSIFMTNGTGFKDMLAEAGLVSYWQALLSGYNTTGWAIASGVLWDQFLFVTVTNGTTHVDTLVCNLPRNAWWRFSNWNAVMYSTAVDIRDELYYADLDGGRVVATSGAWYPTSANKNDADGVAVAPFMESRVMAPTASVKTYGRGWVDYDMRDAAADNPTLAVTVAPGVEATTFSAVPESPLPENTDERRKAISTSKTSQGLTMRLQQSGPSSKTEIYALEVEIMGIGEEYGTQ